MLESEIVFNDPVEDLRGRSVDVSRTLLFCEIFLRICISTCKKYQKERLWKFKL